VHSRDPFEVHECNEGTGGLCGASFLNKAFEDLLRNKLGNSAGELLTRQRLAEANRTFDTRIKAEYDPFDSNCDDEFLVPFFGAPDNPAIGLAGGVLRLSEYYLTL
jgi:hypothetical protein